MTLTQSPLHTTPEGPTNMARAERDALLSRVEQLRGALKKIMDRADEDLHGSVYFSMASRALEHDDQSKGNG